jgi:hypothetical protein
VISPKILQFLSEKCFAFIIAVSLTQIYFPNSSVKFVIASIVVASVFSQFKSSLEILVAVSVAFSVVALSAQLPGMREVFIDQSVVATSAAVFVAIVVLAAVNRSKFSSVPQVSIFGNLFPAFVMFGTSYFWSASRNLGGLSFLGRTEDNAAWLMGLSFGLKSGNGITNISDLGWAGGPTLGMFNALAMSLQQASLSRGYTYFDNIDTIIRSFGLLLTLTLGTAVALVVQFALNQGKKFVVYLPVAVGTLVLIYMGCASAMRLGHYSFLVAIWLMIAALSVSETLQFKTLNIENRKTISVCQQFAIVALVVTASMSWRAITPVGLLIALYFISNAAFEYRDIFVNRFKKSPWVVLPIVGLTGVGLYSLYVFLGGDLENGLNLTTLKKILIIEGGTATVSVLVLIVLLVVTWLPYLLVNSESDERMKNHETVIPLSMLFVFVLMMFISYVTEGHGLYYAVQKYELLLAICMFPLAMKAIVRISSPEKSHWISLGSVLLVLSMFFYDGSLSAGLSYPGVDRSGEVVWAKVAESELRDHPERRVVCLNTSDPDTMFDDYVAYTCNRILIGLQGLEGNDDYEDWTRLGMWLTDTSRLESLPSSYYESITFIVLDPKFSRTADEIVMQAIKSIQWDKARAIDLDGNLVSVPSAG